MRLIHWNAAEAKQKASIIQSAGYEVDYEPSAPEALKKLRENPPSALVIDLTRLPSQGRDIAINIRHAKATRNIPVIFIEGEQEKVNRIKTYIPDALYTDYKHLHMTLREAIAHPPEVTTIPKTVFESYRHTPLSKKLGIKPNSTLTLIDPPKDFATTLGELPQNVTIKKQMSNQPALVILFVRTQRELQKGTVEVIRKLAPDGKLWIAWQKKSSEPNANVTQTEARREGLALGLVDYKICSINETWTALLFARRKLKIKKVDFRK